MKKQEKSFFVDNLAESLKQAKSFVLVEFQGLPVKLQQKLREMLKEVGGSITIAKNSLIKRSIDLSDFKNCSEDLEKKLKGQTAVVLANEDEISPLQVISRFSLEYGFLNFKAGIISQRFCDQDTLIKLSQLPSRSVLETRFISQLASPLYSLVYVLEANMRSLVYLLNLKTQNSNVKTAS